MISIKKWLLVAGGLLATVLGIIGVFLPGLPTTPFILLAAACFAQSSPKLHRQLLQNQLFGPMLADWERHHSLPLRIKWLSTLLMLATVSISILQVEPILFKLGIATLGLIGCAVIWRIPTRNIT